MALGWLLVILSSGCKKFVNAGLPQNELASATVFTTDETALGAMTGVYSTLTSNATRPQGAYSFMPASLSGDEPEELFQ